MPFHTKVLISSKMLATSCDSLPLALTLSNPSPWEREREREREREYHQHPEKEENKIASSLTHLCFDEKTDVMSSYGGAIERSTVLYVFHYYQVEQSGNGCQGSLKVPCVSKWSLHSY